MGFPNVRGRSTFTDVPEEGAVQAGRDEREDGDGKDAGADQRGPILRKHHPAIDTDLRQRHQQWQAVAVRKVIPICSRIGSDGFALRHLGSDDMQRP